MFKVEVPRSDYIILKEDAVWRIYCCIISHTYFWLHEPPIVKQWSVRLALPKMGWQGGTKEQRWYISGLKKQ